MVQLLQKIRVGIVKVRDGRVKKRLMFSLLTRQLGPLTDVNNVTPQSVVYFLGRKVYELRIRDNEIAEDKELDAHEKMD